MKLLIEFGELEMKHWPYPFAGAAPKLRCWFAETFDGPRVKLPEVHGLYSAGGTRLCSVEDVVRVMQKACWLAYPRSLTVDFGGGRYEAQDYDWKVLGGVVVEGKLPSILRAANNLLLVPEVAA